LAFSTEVLASNRVAHLQLAEKLGIPKKYYDKMREAKKFELLFENINALLGNKERRLIRILDGKIRAILIIIIILLWPEKTQKIRHK